jgi:hypothetical protein
MSDKRFDTVLDDDHNVLCYTMTENVISWLKERPKIREGFWVRVGSASGYMSVQDYLNDQRVENEQKITYEVWGFGTGRDVLGFRSDDPVEIVHWLRKFPSNMRTAHNFIALHHMAAAEDIVRKAFKAGSPEGVAKDIIGLMFGH